MKLSKEELFRLLAEFNPKMWKDNDILINCPVCNHRECYVSLKDDHPFNCVRKKKCGWQGNIHALLNKLGVPEGNIKESIKWSDKVSNALILEKHSVIDDIDIELPEIRLPLGFRRIYDDEYLNKRGFIKDDYNVYKVGITNLDRKLINYAVFCIYNDFKLVATIGRYRAEKKEIEELEKKTGRKIMRYRNSGSDFAKILGGYDELEAGITKKVILVEGLFDKKNVDDLLDLYHNEITKCCYTFKCDISVEQVYKLKLKGIEEIVLLYDGDVIEKIKQTGLKLMHDFNVNVALIDGDKDPGEMNLEELNTSLKNLYHPIHFNLKKVQILDL